MKVEEQKLLHPRGLGKKDDARFHLELEGKLN